LLCYHLFILPSLQNNWKICCSELELGYASACAVLLNILEALQCGWVCNNEDEVCKSFCYFTNSCLFVLLLSFIYMHKQSANVYLSGVWEVMIQWVLGFWHEVCQVVGFGM